IMFEALVADPLAHVAARNTGKTREAYQQPADRGEDAINYFAAPCGIMFGIGERKVALRSEPEPWNAPVEQSRAGASDAFRNRPRCVSEQADRAARQHRFHAIPERRPFAQSVIRSSRRLPAARPNRTPPPDPELRPFAVHGSALRRALRRAA